ncbi:MAG: hypothetical protein INR62_13170, partial [Rhodospirillales bacterium]|nr:hypothetical protein [Acetobacter sp.]
MAELLLKAADFVAPGRIEHLARGWLARAKPMQTDPDREAWQVAAALGMAMNLTLFSPSANGVTAFDRMARARRPSEPTEVAALAALRRAQFRLLQIETIGRDGTTQLRDLASEAAVAVLDDTIPPEAAGVALAVHLVPWGNDQYLFAGGITPLDHAALAVAMGFVRLGARRGLVNPQRCAEAIYRHVTRHGTLEIPGLNRPLESLDDASLDEGGELDQLAQRWAKPGATHDPEDIQFVRDQTSLDTLLALLASVANTREHGLGALS